METILITWWLWYIGSHTAVVFAEAWYKIVIVDNLSNTDISVLSKIEKLIGTEIPFYQLDIRDREWLEKVFKEHQIDGVIHFAAKKAVGESCEMPFVYYDNNILWSLSLFETMANHGVKKIVFSSSATVYDPQGTPPFVETDRLNTTNPYGTTKLVIEYLLKDLSANKWFEVVCLRYFNPIGAHPSWLLGENPNGIPNNLLPYIFKVASGELPEVKIFGNDYATSDGTGVRDYIHVMDLAEAHISAYKRSWLQKFEVFNVWTGQWTSVLQLVELVEHITGQKVPSTIVSRRSGDVAVSLANPQKANDILWWKASRSIEDGIRDGWHFIQKLQEWKK